MYKYFLMLILPCVSFASELRDPTVFPENAEVEIKSLQPLAEEIEIKKEFSVSTIIYDNVNPFNSIAVVNNIPLKRGDVIEGYMVTDITNNTVGLKSKVDALNVSLIPDLSPKKMDEVIKEDVNNKYNKPHKTEAKQINVSDMMKKLKAVSEQLPSQGFGE